MKTPRKAGARGSLVLCFFLFISSAAAGNMRLYTETQPHMGTEFTLRAYASEERNEAVATAFEKAFARVETLNQICSDYLPESEINQFAKAPVGERIALSTDLFYILQLAQGIAADSNGAFDVTAGPFVRLWRLSKEPSSSDGSPNHRRSLSIRFSSAFA